MKYDFYIYHAGAFNASQLAQVDAPDAGAQEAANYRYPYARVLICGATKHGETVTPALYCAFAKWAGWERFLTPGVMAATCGMTPGLHTAVCDYPKNNPPVSSRETEADRHETAAKVRMFCELTVVAMGVPEHEARSLSTDTLAGIAAFARGLRMVTLADFMESLQEEKKPFVPGDLEDFDRWHDSKNAMR